MWEVLLLLWALPLSRLRHRDSSCTLQRSLATLWLLPREQEGGRGSSVHCHTVPFDMQVISVRLSAPPHSPSSYHRQLPDRGNNKVKLNEKRERRRYRGRERERISKWSCRDVDVDADDDMSPPSLIQNLVENRTIFCQNLSVCAGVCVGSVCVRSVCVRVGFVFSLVALVLGTGHAPSCSHVKLC